MRTAFAAFALIPLLSCGTRSSSPTQETTRGPTATAGLDRERVEHASMLMRGRGLSDDEWTAWRQDSPDVVAGRLVRDPYFARNAAPALILKHYLVRPSLYAFPRPYALTEAPIEGHKTYFLHKPCPPADVVEIRPWWKPDSQVRVCKDAVRAGVWSTVIDGAPMPCSAYLASPKENAGSTCGCGPNLLRCAPPEIDGIVAMRREAEATVADNIERNAPLAELFLSKSTHRDPIIESIYRRSIAESLELADPLPLFEDDPGQGLRPRRELEPGQHAGLLTSPLLHFTTGDHRQRMRSFFELMWCAEVSAPGAMPEDVLSLKTSDLAEGSDDLSRRPICTNCHARLDSAMTFFAGYRGSLNHAAHWVRGVSSGEGTLYGDHIRDPRGNGPLTPRGFAQLAIRQPEFGRCMARNAVEYVFGTATRAELVDRLATSAPGSELTFRGLVHASLVELMTCRDCLPWSPPMSPRGEPALADLFAENCTDCHYDGGQKPTLEGSIPPTVMARAVDQALSGRMPPTGALPSALRQTFLDAAVREPSLPWSETAAFLRAHTEPAAAMPVFAARETAYRTVAEGQAVPALNAAENALDGRDQVFGPNYATITALSAAAACRHRQPGTDNRSCIDEVLRRVWRRQAPAPAAPR